MGILFTNGTLITAGDMVRADLLVEGEQIDLIGTRIDPAGHTLVDCTGKYLMPGGVDAHTHLHLPLAETSSNSDFDSGHRAAAFGGTTTHIDFAVQPKGGSLIDGIEIWLDKAQSAQIDYSLHANFSDFRPEVLDDIPRVLDYGITSLKVLMAYKESVQIDDTGLFQVMRHAAQYGMLVMVHAENGDIEYLLRKELVASGLTHPRWHAASRPPEIEAEAANRAVTMAGITGCPLYVVHMTCAASVDFLRQGRALGYPVMGETCPQYLALTAERLSLRGFEGAKYVCSPPLRDEADHHALWSALRDGTLQTVATDHCDFWYEGGAGPWQEWAANHDNHQWAEYEAQNPSYRRPGKELGHNDFSRIPNGLPGIEDRLMVTWQLGVNGGEITPSRFVEIHCTNPAKIFGLYPRKGTLAVGSDADIVVWDPAVDHTISASGHHMHTDYNAYEGMRVEGKPVQVYLRGRKIVDGDTWLGENGYGQFLRRTPGITVL
jgi:dihydropyrimidinase